MKIERCSLKIGELEGNNKNRTTATGKKKRGDEGGKDAECAINRSLEN